MLTPQKAAELVDWPDRSRRKEMHDFILNASAREIQLFVHCLNMDEPTTTSREWQSRARMALDIKLADEAERTAQKLVAGTDTLITETKTLVKLTSRLIGLTVVLAIIASFEIFKFLFGIVCHMVDK
jgi:hypothetical protein